MDYNVIPGLDGRLFAVPVDGGQVYQCTLAASVDHTPPSPGHRTAVLTVTFGEPTDIDLN